MKSLLSVVAVSLCLPIPLPSSRAADNRLELTVHAGQRDRTVTPVCVLVDAPTDAKSVELCDVNGKEIAAQLTAPGLLNKNAQGKSYCRKIRLDFF